LLYMLPIYSDLTFCSICLNKLPTSLYSGDEAYVKIS
jgi:hypothetical protein